MTMTITPARVLFGFEVTTARRPLMTSRLLYIYVSVLVHVCVRVLFNGHVRVEVARLG
jgi:hypothetical protein